MKAEKPKAWEELEALVETGDVEVLIIEKLPYDETKLHIMVLDNRRTYKEGEIYELVF